MAKKLSIGIVVGCLIGLFTTSFFLSKGTSIATLFWTKITATSIITGVLCGMYAHLSNSKLQIFLISIGIGMMVFYMKYIITGHNFDPLTMGAFTGALLGAIFALLRKIRTSLRIMRRLRRLRKAGFSTYTS